MNPTFLCTRMEKIDVHKTEKEKTPNEEVFFGGVYGFNTKTIALFQWIFKDFGIFTLLHFFSYIQTNVRAFLLDVQERKVLSQSLQNLVS